MTLHPSPMIANALCCAAVLLSGCARPAPLALKRVVLYQNGVGYFEHRGRFAGSKLRLWLKSHELDDVLKSLTVIDHRGARARPVTAVLPKQGSPKAGKGAKRAMVPLDVHLGHGGVHDLLITYAVPTPAWRAAYRLVLPERPRSGARALLQGWALVNNASGGDWSNVGLTLATGAPMTFAMDLRAPRFVARPDLSGQMVRPVTTGAVVGESAHPDRDRDRDGIADVDDKCPTEPESINGHQDEDGCPDKGRVVIHQSRIEILDKLYFGANKARLEAVSMPIVDAIAATLKGNAQISVIEVQGHAATNEREVWILSSRRAHAVRRALAQRGVKTEVRARAYGATRPVARGATEDAHSRNRRIEFLILRRADDDMRRRGSKPGAVTARAVQRSLHHGAKLSTVAGMTRYRVPGPVSIHRGTTTMVTMINRGVSGEEVFLFRPDANVPGSDRHPQRAARLRNDGKLTLEPGPVSIFARGAFVGEGLIDRLHPGQEAFVPYALDSSANVRVAASNARRPARLVALEAGVATVEDLSRRVTRYEVITGRETPPTMVIKHPRRAGFELLDLPPGTASTATAALIALPLGAAGKSVLEVKEQRAVRRSLTLDRDGGEAERIEPYLADTSALDARANKKLRQLVATRRDVTRLAAAVDGLREQVSQLGERSGQLRESLKAVARTRGATALRRRLLTQLSRELTAMGKATKALAERSLALSGARGRLREQLRTLRIATR